MSLGIILSIFFKCESIAWTPPGQKSWIKCKVESLSLQCAIPALNSGNFAKLPSSNISSISTKFCLIILHEPIVICPTSEFPIWPMGNPTAFSQAFRVAYDWANNFLNTGECAWMIPLCLGVVVFIQNPSRIISASFFIAIGYQVKLSADEYILLLVKFNAKPKALLLLK